MVVDVGDVDATVEVDVVVVAEDDNDDVSPFGGDVDRVDCKLIGEQD